MVRQRSIELKASQLLTGGPFAFQTIAAVKSPSRIGRSGRAVDSTDLTIPASARSAGALFGGSFRLTSKHRRFEILWRLQHLSGRIRREFNETLFMLSYTTAVLGLCWIVDKVAASHVASAIAGSVLK